jgi:hypothetical protein
MTPTTPTTRSERRNLTRLIERALVEGLPLPDLRLEAPERFRISPHQARAAIRATLRRLAREGKAIRPGSAAPEALALAVKRREHLYQECMQKGDRRTALEAEKDCAKLRGLYADHATELSTEDDDEINQAIEAEVARVAHARAAQDAPLPAPHLHDPAAPAAS